MVIPRARLLGVGVAMTLLVASACSQSSSPEVVDRALADARADRDSSIVALTRAGAEEGITVDQSPAVIDLLADGGCKTIGQALDQQQLDAETAREFFAELANEDNVGDLTNALVSCLAAWTDEDPTQIAEPGFEDRWLAWASSVLATAWPGVDDAGTEPDGNGVLRIVIDDTRRRAVDALVAAGEIEQPEPGPAAAVGALGGYLADINSRLNSPFSRLPGPVLEKLRRFDDYADLGAGG